MTVERGLAGVYRPKLTVGGIAAHAYSNVPARPASHGGIRGTNAAMGFLWDLSVAPLDTPAWAHEGRRRGAFDRRRRSRG